MKSLALPLTCLFLTVCSVNSAQAVINKSEQRFDVVPQQTDLLRIESAILHFRDKVSSAKGNNVLAQSESGAWGSAFNYQDEDKARQTALSNCKKYNNEFESEYPCTILYVNGNWHKSENEAEAILAKLPEWVPTDTENVQNVLRSVNEDVDNKDYALALRKYLWFFDNALLHNKHLSAVRLSYGLIGWSKLAKVYPPARTLLHYQAITLKAQLYSAKEADFNRFHEFESINSVMGVDFRTVEYIKYAEKAHPERTKLLLNVAEKALLKYKEYGLLGKYIEPKIDYASALSSYLSTAKYETERGTPEEHRFAEKSFRKDITTMVALLVINDRIDEAQDVVKRARFDLDTVEFDAMLEQALTGEFPVR